MTSKRHATAAIDETYEGWMNRLYRPAVAWTYIVICLFDFLVAPIITFYFYGRFGSGQQYTQWQPLTLIGSGLFHVAMGAIIGVAAWQRGEEKKTMYRTNTPSDYRRNRPYNNVEDDYDTADYRDRLTRDQS